MPKIPKVVVTEILDYLPQKVIDAELFKTTKNEEFLAASSYDVAIRALHKQAFQGYESGQFTFEQADQIYNTLIEKNSDRLKQLYESSFGGGYPYTVKGGGAEPVKGYHGSTKVIRGPLKSQRGGLKWMTEDPTLFKMGDAEVFGHKATYPVEFTPGRIADLSSFDANASIIDNVADWGNHEAWNTAREKLVSDIGQAAGFDKDSIAALAGAAKEKGWSTVYDVWDSPEFAATMRKNGLDTVKASQDGKTTWATLDEVPWKSSITGGKFSLVGAPILAGSASFSDEADASTDYMQHVQSRSQESDAAELEQWANGLQSGIDSAPSNPSFEDISSGKHAQRRPTQDPLGRLPAPKDSLASKIVDNVSEILPSAAKGVHDAVYNATTFIDPLANWLDENVVNLGSYTLENPKTITGNLTKSVTQFLTGFVPALKGLKALGVTNKVAAPVMAGAISDFATRDPHEGRLADLWKEAGLPQNILTDYLASKPNDTTMEARFKNAIESAGLGLAAEGVFLGARAVKAARATSKAKQTEDAHLKAVYGEISDEDIARYVGDPSKPAIETKIVKPPETGKKIAKGAQETAGIEPQGMVRRVPKTGRPGSTWYHGTNDEFTKFEVKGRGAIYFTSDKNVAADIIPGGVKYIKEVEINTQSVFDPVDNAVDKKLLKEIIYDDLSKHPSPHADSIIKGADVADYMTMEREDVQNWLKSKGYKGYFAAESDGSKSLGVMDPSIIKTVDSNFPKTGLKSDDFETYINFGRIEAPEQVKFAIGKLAEGLKGSVDEARRGVITHEATQKMADDLGMTVTDLLKRRKGQPLNAEEALAARQMLTTSGEMLVDLAKKAASPNASALDLFAFRKGMAVHAAIQNEVIAARTETARALSSWAIPAGSKMEKARAIEQVMATMGGPENAREMAKRLAILTQAGATPSAINKFLQRGAGARTMDAVKEVWVNGLLSSPKTHVVNMMSNSLVGVQQIYERAAAAGISKLTGSDGVQFGESLAMAFGLVQSIKEAFKMAAKSLKTGETGYAFNKVDITRPNAISGEAIGMAGTSVGKFADFLGHTATIPGRLLGAEDEFFKTINYRMEVNAQAFRQAKSEGLDGDAFKARVAELIENPPDHIRINAADQAMYATFTNSLGKFGSAIMKLRDVDSPLNPLPFILPFVRTPANITRYTFERTPFAPLVGQWRADLAAGGARADLALARMSTGTAIMMTAMDMASNGHISGAGPSGDDVTVRESLVRSGWQPYSVKVGDRWYSYNRTDPFGTTMGLAASIVESVQKGELDEDDVDEWQEVMAMSIAATSQVVINKTYLEGFSNFVETMSDPKRYSERYVEDLVASFLPATALMYSMKNIHDPYQRDPSTPYEAIQARIAGLSDSLPPRRNLWGEPVSTESGLGRVYDAVSPIASRPEKVNPIDREIVRLNKGPTKIAKKTVFGGARVSLKKFPAVYDEYVRLAGNELKHPGWGMGAKDFLNSVVSGKHALSSVYQIMSDEVRRDFIEGVVSDYRGLAQQQIMADPKHAAFAKEVSKIKAAMQQSKMPVFTGE